MPTHKRPRWTKSKFRLLYLGNDLELMAVLRKALIEPDYRLVSCSDRDIATLFLKSDIPYDLLLIDLEWQETEGLKLARLAHSLEHRKRMPIILVAAAGSTTGSSRQLKTLSRRAGVNESVMKTADMRAFIEAIRRLTQG